MQYTKHPKYTYLKDNTYYFSKQVPRDLLSHYSKRRIILCLNTSKPTHAHQASKMILGKLEEYWLRLRLAQMEVPAERLLSTSTAVTIGMPTIVDAMELYLKLKAVNKGKLFERSAKRNVEYLSKAVGVKSLDKYSTSDASAFRDWLLIKQGVGKSTVQRIFSSIKAMVSLCISELGLDIKNAFQGIYLPTSTPKKRISLSVDTLKKVQSECEAIDDDLRHLVALISDTGMRLAEAVGMKVSDIHLDESIPFIVIQPHSWRSLKTPTSQRIVPLVGSSLWAAKRIVESHNDYCFPRYCDGVNCNSNSASAALNKWIKKLTDQDVVIHGLRHTFRDRLRAITAPLDLIDQLGGWSLQTVGQGYGKGYDLYVLHETLKKALVK